MNAVTDAPYVYVAVRQRGIVNHDEVLCQRHFAESSLRGAYTLQPYEARRGVSILMRPWHGDPRCTQCEDRAGRGAA